jgi:hypothetical protein
MRWAGQVACWRRFKESDNLKDLDADGRIILKLILEEEDGREWT